MATIHGNSYKSIQILGAQDTSGAALYVYWALCAHANERGRAFPKIKTLTYETGRTYPTVVKALKLLRELKLIEDVPVSKRMGKELDIPYQRKVYQVYGSLEVKGKSFPMLYVAGNEHPLTEETESDTEVTENDIDVNQVNINSVNHYKLDSISELDSNKNIPDANASGANSENPEPQDQPTSPDTPVKEGLPESTSSHSAAAPRKPAKPKATRPQSKDKAFLAANAFYKSLDDDLKQKWDDAYYAFMKYWENKERGDKMPTIANKFFKKVLHLLFEDMHGVSAAEIKSYWDSIEDKRYKPDTIDKIVHKVQRHAWGLKVNGAKIEALPDFKIISGRRYKHVGDGKYVLDSE